MADSNAFTAETAQQHQAELNDYLQSKSINQLFIQIVEALLIEKPDNPIGFTVQFLQKKFPEQAAVAGPPADTAAIAVAAAASAPKPSGGAAEEKNGDNSDSDEEDEDDYVEDLPISDKYSKSSGNSKRNSVFSAGAPNISASDVPIIQKEPEVMASIIATLKEQTLFAHYEQAQLETLAGAMEKKTFDAGEKIINEGDPEGDYFYVVASGTVDCYKGQEKVFTYEGKGAFGELAIMYNAPRAATCKAKDKVECWSLQRDHFKVLVMQSSIDKTNKYTEFLKKVDMLKQLNEYELFTMADALKEEKYEPGQRVCRQGDPGNDFYIVKSGVAMVTQTQANGTEQEVAQIGVGSYFGEIALLTTKPRQATVSASDDQPLVVLSLDRKTFTRVMGPMEDILKRNMEQYNKFKSDSI